ncbi:MAG: hypothetical protein ACRDMV_13010 [Streptosporangiales bacterium]
MDELERRLRNLLHDERWSLEPPPDTLDRVHRGVQRRHRRRRVAAGGVSALAVIAVVSTALAVQPMQGESATSGAGGNASSPTPTPEAKRSVKSGKAIPSEPSQQRRTTPPSASAHDRPGGPVPDHFKAASLTAVSTHTFWVLGTAPCDNPVCTSIVRTRDGGQTFRGIPAPKAELAGGNPTGHTVRSLRFASMTDGYAYGGALWTTHDSGSTWRPQSMPGAVVRLEAAAGTAWALVEKNGSFDLYSSPTSQDSWSPVPLPSRLTGPKPDLAVQGSSVTIVGSSGGSPVTLLGTGGSFKALDRPCDASLPARLSPTSGAVWMFCATGTQGTAYVSTSHGHTWRQVSAAPAGGWPNATAIGARTDGRAVLAAGGGIYGVSTGGAVHRRETPNAPAGATFAFVGFTTPQMGYAVLDETSTDSLWRTVDGGRTWRVVSYPSG